MRLSRSRDWAKDRLPGTGSRNGAKLARTMSMRMMDRDSVLIFMANRRGACSAAVRFSTRRLLVPMLGKVLAHFGVHGFIPRLPCAQAVDVAVVHAEGRGNQHRVVNLDIGGALLFRPRNVVRADTLAILLYLAGNRQQSFQLRTHGSTLKIR